MKTKQPGKILTVVIRDYSPVIHLDEPVRRRTVRIELTEQQRAALALRNTHGLDGYEEISQVILEPESER